MVGFGEALRNGIRGAYCTASGPLASGLRLLGNVYDGLGGDVQGDDLRDAANLYSNAAAVYCDRPPVVVTDDDLVQFFDGGQCEDTDYQFSLSFDVQGQGTISYPTARGIGPIQINIVGQDYILTAKQGISGIDQGWIDTGSFNIGFTEIVSNVDLNILSGNPDNCGNQPPGLPPWEPGDFTIPRIVDYDDENGNPRTENVDITISPPPFGDGSGITVPVSVTFENGSSIFGDINLSTGDINLGTDNSAGEGIEDEQRETTEDNIGGAVVVGVRVIVTVDSSGRINDKIPQTGGNPDIRIPNAGYVAFRYRTGESTSGWGRDIPVKNLDFVAWAENPALEVRGTPLSGYGFTVLPIVRSVACEALECCETGSQPPPS